jgi:hypothetical protein
MATIGSRKDVKEGTTYYIDYRVDGKRRRVQMGGPRKEQRVC